MIMFEPQKESVDTYVSSELTHIQTCILRRRERHVCAHRHIKPGPFGCARKFGQHETRGCPRSWKFNLVKRGSPGDRNI